MGFLCYQSVYCDVQIATVKKNKFGKTKLISIFVLIKLVVPCQ